MRKCVCNSETLQNKKNVVSTPVVTVKGIAVTNSFLEFVTSPLARMCLCVALSIITSDFGWTAAYPSQLLLLVWLRLLERRALETEYVNFKRFTHWKCFALL